MFVGDDYLGVVVDECYGGGRKYLKGLSDVTLYLVDKLIRVVCIFAVD